MTLLAMWSLRALGVVLLGALLILALRRRSAATRNLVLRATLVVAWILPLLVLVAPQVYISPLSSPPAPLPRRREGRFGSGSVAPKPIVTQGWSVERVEKPTPTVGLVRRTPFSTLWIDLPALILPLWSLGTGLLVLRWGAGMVRLRRLSSGRQRETSVDYDYAKVPVPLTYGRTILLPEEAREWPEARIRAAVLHERAHVARRDWHWQTLAALFCALHWPNPFAWLLARLLRDTSEAAADDVVLQEMQPSEYARALLDVAKSARRSDPALAMARRGGVADRIGAVLSFRDRRDPTRRTVAFVLTLLTVMGLGIAGTGLRQALASRTNPLPRMDGVRPLHTGGTLRLVAIFEGRKAWQTNGLRVADRKGPDGFRPSQGRRAVTFEFERVESGKSSGPGILTRDFLHQTGTPQLLVDTPDEIEMVAPHPRNSSSATGDAGSKVSPQGLLITHPTFTRELDPKLETTDVLVRLSSGPATVSGEPVRVLKTERLARASSIDGKWYPGVRILALVPKTLRRETVLLRAYDAKGIMIEGSSPVAPFADGTVSVTYDVADPKEIVRFEWAHRHPEFVKFKGVRLRPDAVTPQSSGEDSVMQTGPASMAHGVELVGLWDGNRIWRANGAQNLNLSTVSFRARTRPGWRRINLAFRVTNASELKEPALAATAWGKYAYPSDASMFRDSSHSNEKMAYCTIQLRPGVKIANLGVDVQVGPWRTDAEAPVGLGGASLRTVQESAGMRWVDVSLPNGFAGLPGRLEHLECFGVDGRLLSTVVAPNPPGLGTRARCVTKVDETVARVVKRSRVTEHFRFDDVHLEPSS